MNSYCEHSLNYFAKIYVDNNLFISPHKGPVIRLRRIYNFWCSMLDYILVPHIFIMFLYHFGMIYGTNLLTRCLVPVPIFHYLFISEKLFCEVSWNGLKIYVIYFQVETKTEPKGRPEGGSQPPDALQARPHPWPCLGSTWATPPRSASSPIN